MDGDIVTRDGATVGTFDYISPEQARHSRSVGPAADLYSLGCTLYHMIAGRVPFPSPSLPEKLYAHQLNEPEPLAEVDPGTPDGLAAQHVIARLMRTAEERHANARRGGPRFGAVHGRADLAGRDRGRPSGLRRHARGRGPFGGDARRLGPGSRPQPAGPHADQRPERFRARSRLPAEDRLWARAVPLRRAAGSSRREGEGRGSRRRRPREARTPEAAVPDPAGRRRHGRPGGRRRARGRARRRCREVLPQAEAGQVGDGPCRVAGREEAGRGGHATGRRSATPDGTEVPEDGIRQAITHLAGSGRSS